MKTFLRLIHLAASAVFALAAISNIANAAQVFDKVRTSAAHHHYSAAGTSTGNYSWIAK